MAFIIALYIILGLLFFLFVLLLIPVNIFAFYEEKLIVRITYAFFTFDLLPRRPKAKKSHPPEPLSDSNASEDKDKDNSKSNASELLDRISDKDFRTTLISALKLTLKFFKKSIHHITIDNLNFNLSIVSGDAAKTAIIYGGISSILYPIFTAVKNYSKCKNFSCNINPGFLLDKSYLNFTLSLNIRPLFPTLYMISLVFGLFRLFLDSKYKKI